MFNLKLKCLDWSECRGILEAMGSASDPIFHRGEETTPNDLEFRVQVLNDGRGPTERTVIEFYSGSRRLHRVKGTVRDMVKDRLTWG